jgi:hypothetical protein
MDKKEYQKNYRELKKKEIKEYKREWYNKNKDVVLEKSKSYYEKNKEKIRERNKLHIKEKNNSDVNYRIKQNVLKSVISGLNDGFFEERLEKMLGYTARDLMKRLSDSFERDMHWYNCGHRFISENNWHIHHIVPMKIFNFYNSEEIKNCWDLDNLVPLWNYYKNDD